MWPSISEEDLRKQGKGRGRTIGLLGSEVEMRHSVHMGFLVASRGGRESKARDCCECVWFGRNEIPEGAKTGG